jgi:26S proteasome regulatory subunit N12
MTNPHFKEVLKAYQSLNVEWNRDEPNVTLCGEKLKELKIGLIHLGHLPLDAAHTSKQDLVVARDILEIGARWAVATKNIPEFENYMNQLKTFYFDYRESMQPSAYMYELLGLNLLCLLAQGRLSDFHVELERLTVDDVEHNMYIKYPVSMEQYIMEGCYNHLFLSRSNVPSDRYNYFIDILLSTTRDEIASCIESAYESLPVTEATRLLFFNKKTSSEKVIEFGAKRKWTISLDKSTFHFHLRHQGVSVAPSNASQGTLAPTGDGAIWKEVATTLMLYAKDLDTII